MSTSTQNKYTYFVSFRCSSGVGNIDMALSEPVGSITNVQCIQEAIETKHNLVGVIVINFILLSTPSSAQGTST